MMIKKVFFDANIILDMIDSDRGNVESVRRLVYNALMKDIVLYTSCDILSNVYYVARKKLEKSILIEEMLRILEIFDIVAIDKPLAKNALLENKINLPSDFEDLLQGQCAMVSECDLIVTNDKKFAKGKVKHLSLEEALKTI
ncbi:MAG TPA: PIN domain-containing protein [Epsilonproteobacteria bacterium]|nr:PIN domain-containing protein [Campylobacterota bacterium]